MGAKHGKVSVPSLQPKPEEVFESKSGRIACLLEALPCLAPSLVRIVHEYEYVVCVHVLDGINKAHVRYDPQLNQWLTVGSVTSPRYHSAATVLGGYLYAIGGEIEGPVRDVDRYDPNLNEWLPVAPMLFKRRGACAVTVANKLYVLGGFDGLSRLSTMERYDPVTKEWTQLPGMTVSLGPSLAAIEYENAIYVLGGGSSLDKVEKFDLESNQWTQLAPMKRPRYALAAVVVGQFIYALGGDDCQFTLAECEKYDPATDTWADIPPMSTPRQNFAAVALDTRLYCLGGFQNSQPMSPLVEMYETTTGTWSLVGEMPSATCRHAAVCL
jgi:N-acetylneuraminic acid mutarotase